MSEVAAPAAAAAPTTSNTAPNAAPNTGTETAAETPDVNTIWKQVAKDKVIKVHGKERKLEDFSLDEVQGHISRGLGASQAIEESKKARAEADKILAIQKKIAEGNDEEALEALFGISGERGIKLLEAARQRFAKEAEEESQMTERERQMRAEIQRRDEELRQHKTAAQQRAQQEQEAEQKRVFAEVRTKAMGHVTELTKAMSDLPASHAEALLPYVARATKESMELGQELGRDIKPEAIRQRAQELFKASTHDFYDSMTPEDQFRFIGLDRVKKLSALYVAHVRGGSKVAAAQKPIPTQAEKKPSTTSTDPQLGSPQYLSRR